MITPFPLLRLSSRAELKCFLFSCFFAPVVAVAISNFTASLPSLCERYFLWKSTGSHPLTLSRHRQVSDLVFLFFLHDGSPFFPAFPRRWTEDVLTPTFFRCCISLCEGGERRLFMFTHARKVSGIEPKIGFPRLATSQI